MTPIREQIMTELSARLARLLTSGECQRCVEYSDDEEFVAIWDIDEENETSGYNRTQHDLQIAVVYTLDYREADFAEKLNSMLADLVYQIHRNSEGDFDEEINGLADNIECTTSAMKFPRSGSEHISVGATFHVRYATTRGDPYSQP